MTRPFLDCFVIVLNEEELLSYCLESFCSIADMVNVVSLVDNGSTDASLDIIDSFRQRLPIVLQRETGHAHHGDLRNKAISVCRSPWIFYLDADETFTSDMREWLMSDAKEQGDVWEFYKYTTIVDRYHYVEGGNGPCHRLFRNGMTFTQPIHTDPAWLNGSGHRKVYAPPGPFLFDHTACKSVEALWAKGWRYQWAVGVEGIGPEHEYVGRVENAHRLGLVREFDEAIKSRIFTGP